MTQDFSYRRGIAPPVMVLLGLCVLETLAVHLVVLGLWGWRPAAVLGVIDVTVVAMLVRLLLSFRRHPVRIEGETVTLALGSRRRVRLDLAAIAHIRGEPESAAILKARDTLNLALIAWPNIVVELHAPVRVGRRDILRIAHRLDEPTAFCEAVTTKKGGSRLGTALF